MRPKRVYDSPKQVCIDLISGRLTLSNFYSLKSRAKSNNDTVQYKILVSGFKSFKLLKAIKE